MVFVGTGLRTLIGLWAVLSLCLTLVAYPVAGQDALVLSGGGARGIAHAGALVGLDSLGFDPDLVAGTSMGAIVGGLYAAGYEPQEIWRLMEEHDWQETFSPAAILVGSDRSPRHPVLRFELTPIRLRSPRGVIDEWRINRTLLGLLFDAGARSRGDFDLLARRFRAVVVDLASAERVALGEGSLALAVRISMSVPGFFGPVVQEDQVLVDGGIVDYLPVGVAREMGARRIVAVDVLQPSDEVESLSPVRVGSRSFHILNVRARDDEAAPDVLILPPLDPGITAASFLSEKRPILEAGRVGALDALGGEGGRAIGGLGGGSGSRSLPPPPTTLVELRVETSEPALANLARWAFGPATEGPYDADKVLASVDRLYGTGVVDGVWPRVEAVSPGSGGDTVGGEGADPQQGPESPGRVGEDGDKLVVRVDPSPSLLASAGVGYDNDRGGRIWGTVQQRVMTETVPVTLGVEGSVSPLDRWGGFSVVTPVPPLLPLTAQAEVHYREQELRFANLFHPASSDSSGLEATDESEVRRVGGSLGVGLWDAGRGNFVVASLQSEYVRSVHGREGWSVGPLFRFQGPTPLVRPVGDIALLEGEVRWGEVSYWRARARGSLTAEAGPWLLAATADAEVAEKGAPPDVLPSLGSEHVMPGLRWDAERGRGRLVAGVDAGHPLPLGGTLRLRARGGLLLDDLDDDGDDTGMVGMEVAGIWWTPFGGVQLGVGGNSLGEWRIDVNVGPEF
jgi:predicted acylesterase/phospholipase RssA